MWKTTKNSFHFNQSHSIHCRVQRECRVILVFHKWMKRNKIAQAWFNKEITSDNKIQKLIKIKYKHTYNINKEIPINFNKSIIVNLYINNKPNCLKCNLMFLQIECRFRNSLNRIINKQNLTNDRHVYSEDLSISRHVQSRV